MYNIYVKHERLKNEPNFPFASTFYVASSDCYKVNRI